MCTVVVKRRLAMVTSIRSANSRSVGSSVRHESFTRGGENSAVTKQFLRFWPKLGLTALKFSLERPAI